MRTQEGTKGNLMRKWFRRIPDERGVEAPAMLIVLPVLCVLVFVLIDAGVMIRTRIAVQNVVQEAARSAAADGGNYNPRTNTIGESWSTYASKELYKNGKCTFGRCQAGKVPTVTCNTLTDSAGTIYYSNVAEKAGDLITCTVNYPYVPINGGLFNGPIGLGFGGLFKSFTVSSTARAETGSQSSFG